MLSKTERDAVIALIKREVVPAIGCTEPIAVALCVARACELLGSRPEKIEVRLSANILKNAMGVGIPGTGMIGLPIAIALGALVGRSEYGLEVLKDADAEAVEQGKKYIAEKRISVDLKKDIEEKTLHRSRSLGRRASRHGRNRGRPHQFRLSAARRRSNRGFANGRRRERGRRRCASHPASRFTISP